MSRLPSYDESAALEAIFIEKREIALERQRLIDATKELEKIKEKIRLDMENEVDRMRIETEKIKLKYKMNESISVSITPLGDHPHNEQQVKCKRFSITWLCGSFRRTEEILYSDGMRGIHRFWEISTISVSSQNGWQYFNNEGGRWPLQYSCFAGSVGSVIQEVKSENPWVKLVAISVNDPSLVKKIAYSIQTAFSTYSSYLTPLEEFMPTREYFIN